MACGDEHKVVVIGAGIAGLTAAYRLHQQGIDVALYEARGRVGGRILTVLIEDQAGELGAQNLFDGGKANHICKLTEEFGLEIQTDFLPLHHAYFSKDEFISGPALYPPFGEPYLLHSQLTAIAKKSRNMFEVLSALFNENEVAFKSLSVRLASYEGAPIDKLSSCYTETLYHMLLGGISAAHQEQSIAFGTIKGGNGRLPEKIAQKLCLHLNTPLASVSKTDEKYTLHFQNGHTVRTKILILAIPCSVYNDIDFKKGVISEEQLSHIRSIRYGTNAKILVPVPKEPQQKISLINNRMCAFFGSSRRLLTCYYTGTSSCFLAETIENTFNLDRPMLERKRYCNSTPPVLARDASFITYQTPAGYSWPNDPFAKGSYSYISPGQEELLTKTKTVRGETVKALFAPIDGTLYFAGEHATILQDVPGTLEAACESGERVARMIAGSTAIREIKRLH